jgi:hypothetical protein
MKIFFYEKEKNPLEDLMKNIFKEQTINFYLQR